MELNSEASAGVPRWLNLFDGARVRALPINSAIVYAARARADALLVQAAEARTAVTKAGGLILGLPDLSDPIEQSGVWAMFYAICVAELTVTDWDGVTRDRQPLPFRPELLVQLLADDRVSDAFTRQQLGRHNAAVVDANF